ncbi:hypothetical protein C475_11340 [Halosimplex carlsbadense 2-9-1]|uniref:Uncharacterized protein n=1 Tax=Halosimplex carlsbadense 2-9-1 TaxID=797114 RepID=M0CQZ5_9EURY|nr:hypothetical protein [Halosimplex carlsbadense]ELZ24827.1 hypothetical protein C475_11340 [Halosimplex carlsbadense 2-9-1]
MDPHPSLSRRSALRLSALAAAGVAGCTTFESGSDTGSPANDPTTATSSDGTAGSGVDSATPALDLREANVTAVEVESASGDAVRFSVTLYHDDDGEDGYADWWQVETLDGDRLARRELLHPHSTDPFTRSETVEVPDGTGCVAVRGHDQTHGYGGRAMLVNPEGGATRAVEQEAEKRSLADADCP